MRSKTAFTGAGRIIPSLRELYHNLGERAEVLAGPALCLLELWFILAQLLGLPF